MPASLFIGDFKDIRNNAESAITGNEYIDIDSIVNPKTDIRCFALESNSSQKSQYLVNSSGPFKIPPNRHVRVWFLPMRSKTEGSGIWYAYPETCLGVTVMKNERYSILRGAG